MPVTNVYQYALKICTTVGRNVVYYHDASIDNEKPTLQTSILIVMIKYCDSKRFLSKVFTYVLALHCKLYLHYCILSANITKLPFSYMFHNA